MSNVALLFAVLIVIAVLNRLIRRRAGGRSVPAWPMERRSPLTVREQALYFQLLKALPEYVVLSQVALSRLVEVKRVPDRGSWWNRISQKSVDFVVCDRSFSALGCIEFDDSTHSCADRVKADSVKDSALTAAGVRILRWKSVPDIQDIRGQFNLASIETAPTVAAAQVAVSARR